MKNKIARLANDTVLFILLLFVLLIAATVVLLYAPLVGSLNMFVPFACLCLNIVLTYVLGLQKGLMLALVLIFAYGSYLVYATTFAGNVSEVNFGLVSWLLFFPLGIIIAGNFAVLVAKYRHVAQDKKHLEELIAIDANTGFYKSQEFFKRLEEEYRRAQRYNTVFSILLIQVANLDELRIIYGELSSLKIIKKLAETIDKNIRCTDCKFLLAHNMLGIILTETDEQGAKVVIEKLHMLLDRINTEVRAGVKKVVRIKPNIGYACYRTSDQDSLVLYDRAVEELKYDKA